MAITLNNITLPEGLRWSDRYSWTPVLQSTEVSLAGSFLVDEEAQLSGRPITLTAAVDECWITKASLDALYALLGTPGLFMTLDLGSEAPRTVIWRRDVEPLSAEVLKSSEPAAADDLYALKQLAFFEVAP